jgi:hypothetical protein
MHGALSAISIQQEQKAEGSKLKARFVEGVNSPDDGARRRVPPRQGDWQQVGTSASRTFGQLRKRQAEVLTC